MRTPMVKVTEREETKIIKIKESSLDADFAKELAVLLLEGDGIKLLEHSWERSVPEYEFAGWGTHFPSRHSCMPVIETLELQLPKGITLEIKRESFK